MIYNEEKFFHNSKEEKLIMKRNISRYGGGKLTPSIHSGNMDKRSEFPDPWKVRSSSDRDERQIPIFGYENELLPWRRSVIWSIQEKWTAIGVRRQRDQPHTWYPPRNYLQSPEPTGKTYLKKPIHPRWSGRRYSPSPRERSPQGEPRASCFPNNGIFMEKSGWEDGDWKVTRRQQKEKQKCLLLCCVLTLIFYVNPQCDR